MPITFIVPDVGVVPVESLMVEAAEWQAALAASELRLFKSELGAVSGETTLAELEEAECGFSGYTAGGNTITAFGDPFTDPDGPGVLVVGPTSQFNFVTPVGEPVTEEVGGFYLVDSEGALRMAVNFDTPVLMADDSCSIPVVPARRFE